MYDICMTYVSYVIHKIRMYDIHNDLPIWICMYDVTYVCITQVSLSTHLDQHEANLPIWIAPDVSQMCNDNSDKDNNVEEVATQAANAY